MWVSGCIGDICCPQNQAVAEYMTRAITVLQSVSWSQSAVCESILRKGLGMGKGDGRVNQPQRARLKADHQWHSAAIHIPCEWHAAALAHFSPLRDHLWALQREEDMHKTRLRPWGWCVDGKHGCRKFTDTESLLWNQRGQAERRSTSGHTERMIDTRHSRPVTCRGHRRGSRASSAK